MNAYMRVTCTCAHADCDVMRQKCLDTREVENVKGGCGGDVCMHARANQDDFKTGT